MAGTVAVSFSATFIRLAGDDAATIVWLRMGMASVLLSPWLVAGIHRRVLPRGPRQSLLVVASGALLCGHFLLWTASLRYTSVAASVLLVSLHPVIVPLLSRRFFGERVSSWILVGVILAITGTVITCSGDLALSPSALLGDFMALGGALCLAGYLLIGRGLRGSMGVAPYSAIVYMAVAAGAASVSLVTHSAHVPTARTALFGLALAVVCTIGGHTVYNWTLRYVSATTVSIAFLGEAPLTAILALIILGVRPTSATVAGGLVILTGLGVATLCSARATRRVPAELDTGL